MRRAIFILGLILSAVLPAGELVRNFGYLELRYLGFLLDDPFQPESQRHLLIYANKWPTWDEAQSLLERHLDGVEKCLVSQKADAKKLRTCLRQATHPIGENIWHKAAPGEPIPVCR